MNRHEKVKIIYDITKENNLNLSTITFLLAVTTDKGLTKLVKEFQERFPKKDLVEPN